MTRHGILNRYSKPTQCGKPVVKIQDSFTVTTGFGK